MYEIQNPRQWLQKWPKATELNKQIRWNLYRPNQLDPRIWQKLIGNDANNLRHMELQYRIGAHMCNVLQVTQEVRETVLLTELHHDIVEIETGDKAKQLKVVGEEEDEIILLSTLLDSEVPFLALSKQQRECIITTMRDADLPVPTTAAGAIFKSSEYLGYARTMLRMFRRHAQESAPKTCPVIAQHMSYVVQSVFANTGGWIFEFMENNAHLHPECVAYIQAQIKIRLSQLQSIADLCANSEASNAWLEYEETVVLNGQCSQFIANHIARQKERIICNIERVRQLA